MLRRGARQLAATGAGSRRACLSSSSSSSGCGGAVQPGGVSRPSGGGERPSFGSGLAFLQAQTDRFDCKLPLEEALCAPSSWYTSPEFASLDHEVFARSWLHVGYEDELSEVGSFRCVDAGSPLVLIRGEEGIRCFHNVCSHHAMAVTPLSQERGQLEKMVLTCPYHGWQYDANDGRLRKATRIGGLKNFKVKNHGLKEVELKVMGRDELGVGLLFARQVPGEDSLEEAMRPMLEKIATFPKNMRFVRRVAFDVASNWKVFCDNYLDGGYHVPHAHADLAAGIDMSSYKSTVYPGGSLQLASGGGDERLGGEAAYGFLYPTFMMNRYGPWLDTNTVSPLSPTTCRVVFDYFLEEGHDDKFIEESLAASAVVQEEDDALCAGVQRGLGSRAYDQGRYNPNFEEPMHAFHLKLKQDYARILKAAAASAS